MKKLILIFLLIGNIVAQAQDWEDALWYGKGGTGDVFYDVDAVVPNYDDSADSLFALMTVQPSSARKQVISNVYAFLKDSLGISSLNQAFDGFYILKTTDSNDSKLDWTFNSNFSTVNLLTFKVDTGWVRNVAGSYINSGINISTATNFTQNSGSLMFWSYTDANETSIDIGVYKDSPRFDSRISSRLGGFMYGHINTSTISNTLASATSIGFFASSRTGANLTGYYKNADSLVSFTTASIALISADIFLTGANNGAGALSFGSTRLYGFFAIGKGFTKSQVRAIYYIVKYYMDNW